MPVITPEQDANIRKFEDLYLPSIMSDIAMQPQGIVLLCGVTGDSSPCVSNTPLKDHPPLFSCPTSSWFKSPKNVLFL